MIKNHKGHTVKTYMESLRDTADFLRAALERSEAERARLREALVTAALWIENTGSTGNESVRRFIDAALGGGE